MNPWGFAVAGLGGVAVYVGIRGTQKSVASMLGFNPGSSQPAAGGNASATAGGTAGVTAPGPNPITGPTTTIGGGLPWPLPGSVSPASTAGAVIGLNIGDALRKWLHDHHIWPWDPSNTGFPGKLPWQ